LPCLPLIPMVFVAAFAVSDTVDAADDTWAFTASAARPSVDALRWLSDSVCASRRSPCIASPTYAVVRIRHGLGTGDACALALCPLMPFFKAFAALQLDTHLQT